MVFLFQNSARMPGKKQEALDIKKLPVGREVAIPISSLPAILDQITPINGYKSDSATAAMLSEARNYHDLYRNRPNEIECHVIVDEKGGVNFSFYGKRVEKIVLDEEGRKNLAKADSALSSSTKRLSKVIQSIGIGKTATPEQLGQLAQGIASDSSLGDYRIQILADENGQVSLRYFEAEPGSGLKYGDVRRMQSRTKGAGGAPNEFLKGQGKQGEIPKKRQGIDPTKDEGGNAPNAFTEPSDNVGATLAEIVFKDGKAVGKVFQVSKPETMAAQPDAIGTLPLAAINLNTKLTVELPDYIFGPGDRLVPMPVPGIGDSFLGKGKFKGHGKGKGDFLAVQPIVGPNPVLPDPEQIFTWVKKWKLKEIEFERQEENKNIKITWDRHLYDTYTDMRVSGNPKDIIRTALGVVLEEYNRQNIYGIPREGEAPPLLARGKPLNYLGFELRTANIILPGAEIWYAGQLLPQSREFSYRVSAGYGLESSKNSVHAAFDLDTEVKWAIHRTNRTLPGAAIGASFGYSPGIFGRPGPEARAAFLLGFIDSDMINNGYKFNAKVGSRYTKSEGWTFDMSISYTFYNPGRELPFFK